jgi:hypothetical protein
MKGGHFRAERERSPGREASGEVRALLGLSLSLGRPKKKNPSSLPIL